MCNAIHLPRDLDYRLKNQPHAVQAPATFHRESCHKLRREPRSQSRESKAIRSYPMLRLGFGKGHHSSSGRTEAIPRRACNSIGICTVHGCSRHLGRRARPRRLQPCCCESVASNRNPPIATNRHCVGISTRTLIRARSLPPILRQSLDSERTEVSSALADPMYCSALHRLSSSPLKNDRTCSGAARAARFLRIK